MLTPKEYKEKADKIQARRNEYLKKCGIKDLSEICTRGKYL